MTVTSSDSKTLHTQTRKTRFSDRITINCDPETKKAILAFSAQTGLSLCQLYDALTKAFLHGVSVQKDLGVQSPTINLSIERVVKRVRRYGVEGVEGGERVPKDVGGLANCFVCPPGIWVYREEEVLNSQGHAAGCECLLCRGRK